MQWWKRLRRNRWAQVGAYILLVFYACAIFAEFVAPYSPLESQPGGSLLPPTAIHFWDESGAWIGPHVYPTRQGPVDLETGERPLLVDTSRPAGIRLFVAGTPYRWLGLIPWDRHLFGTVPLRPVAEAGQVGSQISEEPPVARLHLLGTDDQGRDYFSRLVYGGRVSLFIGLVGIGISFPIGLLVGAISGYLGGWVDTLLMRLAEVLMSIPTLYLLVSLAAVLQVNPLTGVPFSNAERFLVIVVILSFVGWAGLARVIRGQVLSLRERDFVQAARVAGAGSLYLLVRHILPQTTTYVVISATLAVPGYIVAESVLSLIGLGIQQPDASWGNMLSLATNASVIILQPWLVLAPTLMVVLTSLSFNLLGDGLRDALDPRDPDPR
ncbi:ABC transporter permease [Synechococcus sp. R6-6]|uniref:ABC transporter permease n=1 Tax=unclassified Synechococcus TaxID=2626047 RepID=UPI0039C17E78